jgi:predicted dehydrogenase
VELVAVSDPSETLSRGVSERYGVMGFTDSKELLGADLDAVVIAVPDRFHEGLGIEALEARKHVLMEKPLAASPGSAQRMADMAVASNLRLQTGAMKRHDPGIAFAHRHLGEIGALISYNSVYRVPAMRPAIEATLFPHDMVVDVDVRATETTFKQQGNRAAYLLATHGAHVFDMLVHFTGPPRWIRVAAAEVGDDYTWHCTVGLAGGGLGSLEMTVDVHSGWAEGFELFGSGGHIWASIHQPFWKRSSDVDVYLEDSGVSRRPHPGDTDAFKLQIEAFADAIRNGGGESPSPQDGVLVTRIIEAAGESATRDGETVEL